MKNWCLRQVAPTELAGFWPLVAPGLGQACARARSPLRPEDLLGELQAGRATLHVGLLGGCYAGALVLKECREPYSGRRLMYLWAAYACRPGVLELALAEICALARAVGIHALCFESPRAGWARRLKRAGFVIKDVTYQKEL